MEITSADVNLLSDRKNRKIICILIEEKNIFFSDVNSPGIQ